MNTLKIVKELFDLDLSEKPPIKIDGTRAVDLCALFRAIKAKQGVEVGVEQGVYSEVLCKGVPEAKIYGVDSWQAYKGYREHVSQEKLDQFYATTLERMQGYDNYFAIKEFSVEASKRFKDNELDFVYIDGNHEFFQVVADLKAWIPKVKTGGIVAGHDFKRNSARYVNDVKDVVQAYAYAKKLTYFVLTEPYKETAPSWFFIK